MATVSEFLAPQTVLSDAQRQQVDKACVGDKLSKRTRAYAILYVARGGDGSAADLCAVSAKLGQARTAVDLFVQAVGMRRQRATLPVMDDATLRSVARAARASLEEPDTFSALLDAFLEPVPRVATPEPPANGSELVKLL